MQHFTLFGLALAASGASAALLPRQGDSTADGVRFEYLARICSPTLNNGSADLNAPCNIVSALGQGCAYGYKVQQELAYGCGDPENCDLNGDSDPPMQSNTTQRACACESQYFEETMACQACLKAHGGVEGTDYFPDSLVSSLSSSYCAASATPSLGLIEFLYSYATVNGLDSAATTTAAAASSFTDPIGNSTAVSYYYTPSVTGTAAWEVPASTSSGVSTSSGQIVATATGSPGVAVSSEAGTVAGVFGFAALVALL